MRFGLAGILLLLGTTVTHGAIASGPITNPANGHDYYLLTSASWPVSEAEAITLGGHLVTINDAAENNWVYSTFSYPSGTDRALWIGLNDAAVEGELVWPDGAPLGYSNWYSPNQNSATADYVYMLPLQAPPTQQGGKWVMPTAFIIQGVVELPEPTGLAVLFSAVPLLMRRHHRAK